MLQEGMEALTLSHILIPMHLFHLSVPKVYPLVINQYLISKMFFNSVSHSIKLIESIEDVIGTSNV